MIWHTTSHLVLLGVPLFWPEDSRRYCFIYSMRGICFICMHVPILSQVVSVNFNPFYRNAKEVVKKEEFQVNYRTICVQQDIFAQNAENLLKVRSLCMSKYNNS